ncbi:hypothetical protein XENTR_v10005606 [Xenopus tropicalis]|nr:hypothetical protein XENTR_v10005606 [Xenopus tropicalis]
MGSTHGLFFIVDRGHYPETQVTGGLIICDPTKTVSGLTHINKYTYTQHNLASVHTLTHLFLNVLWIFFAPKLFYCQCE